MGIKTGPPHPAPKPPKRPKPEKDYVTTVLERLLEEVKKMTVEEYEQFYTEFEEELKKKENKQ